MNELVDKYIELLLNRCVNFNNSKSLLISYEKEYLWFVEKIVNRARELGVLDIRLYDEDTYGKHKVLKNISAEEIENHEFFLRRKVWDDYALKGASFIILETEFPGLMDDIKPEILGKARFFDRAVIPIYKKLQNEFKIPWCIAAMPSKIWAKDLFPTLSEKEAYKKLFILICKSCMVDTVNPVISWNDFLNEQAGIVKKLNDLNISKLHYTNSLGTDLFLDLPKDVVWCSAGNLGEGMIPNMPSYEIFTTPDYRKTEGIVYGSRPLCYNGGIIDEYYLTFCNGKVIDYDAKIGKELLKSIIESDENAAYLGEVALVSYDSPISNTGIIYKNILFDENCSTHIALGDGYPECIKNGADYSKGELIKKGINFSQNHVDMMIGTNDLTIEAETNQGKKLILVNGNINLYQGKN